MRSLENWIQSYLDYTQDSEAPEIYRKWSAISAISAVLQRQCWLQWHQPLYPNFFIVLVGPSGGRKSTAIHPARRLLDDLDIRVTAESITREALIQEIKASQRSFIHNGEEISHCSLTVFASELAVFLGYGNNAFLSDLCDFFDCSRKWRYKTKHQGDDVINNLYLNLLGCITPKLLGTALPQDAIGGGLISRMIFVYAEGRGKKVAIPVFDTDEELYSKLLRDLEIMHTEMHGNFKVTGSFKEAWKDWYNNEDRTLEVCHQLEAYTERRATHLLKLCLIMNASTSGTMILEEEDFILARDTLYEMERDMNKTFSAYGRSDLAEVLDDVMKRILNAKGGVLKFSDLYHAHLTNVSVQEMDSIIDSLVAINFCKVVYNDEGIKFIQYLSPES